MLLANTAKDVLKATIYEAIKRREPRFDQLPWLRHLVPATMLTTTANSHPRHSISCLHWALVTFWEPKEQAAASL